MSYRRSTTPPATMPTAARIRRIVGSVDPGSGIGSAVMDASSGVGSSVADGVASPKT